MVFPSWILRKPSLEQRLSFSRSRHMICYYEMNFRNEEMRALLKKHQRLLHFILTQEFNGNVAGWYIDLNKITTRFKFGRGK